MSDKRACRRCIATDIRETKHLIWRNLPDYPTTFGPCSRKCDRGMGRGSGPCVHCAKDDLAKIVGEDLASNYVEAVLNIRNLEKQMEKYAVQT